MLLIHKSQHAVFYDSTALALEFVGFLDSRVVSASRKWVDDFDCLAQEIVLASEAMPTRLDGAEEPYARIVPILMQELQNCQILFSADLDLRDPESARTALGTMPDDLPGGSDD